MIIILLIKYSKALILCVDFGAAAATDEGNIPAEPGKT